MATTKDQLLTYADVAREVGVGVRSIREYNTRAARNRRLAEAEGDPSLIRPGDLPAPDKVAGQSPLWKASTIEQWKKTRKTVGRPRTR